VITALRFAPPQTNLNGALDTIADAARELVCAGECARLWVRVVVGAHALPGAPPPKKRPSPKRPPKRPHQMPPPNAPTKRPAEHVVVFLADKARGELWAHHATGCGCGPCPHTAPPAHTTSSVPPGPPWPREEAGVGPGSVRDLRVRLGQGPVGGCAERSAQVALDVQQAGSWGQVGAGR
jgi:hypothetical protein